MKVFSHNSTITFSKKAIVNLLSNPAKLLSNFVWYLNGNTFNLENNQQTTESNVNALKNGNNSISVFIY